MKYLIYRDWPNTSKNHAGIKYLCYTLSERYPNDFIALPTPTASVKWKKSRFGLIQKFYNWHGQKQKKRKENDEVKAFADRLILLLKPKDEIFFMEYMHPMVGQQRIVEALLALGCNNRMLGMAHMPPKFMDENFSDEELKKWVNPMDCIITLGHTLTNYFRSRGIAEKKLYTTFHYVDDYYLIPEVKIHEDFKVFTMGYNYRDNQLLYNIITSCKDIHFVVCEGVGNMQEFRLPNVTLLPFIPEEELRDWMAECDVSLNVMYDTIGSNVIVTSLGMGMAMVCSNVGSIHDYCDEANTLFCKNQRDFVSSIRLLYENKERLQAMRMSARLKAEAFSLNKSMIELNRI